MAEPRQPRWLSPGHVKVNNFCWQTEQDCTLQSFVHHEYKLSVSVYATRHCCWGGFGRGAPAAGTWAYGSDMLLESLQEKLC